MTVPCTMQDNDDSAMRWSPSHFIHHVLVSHLIHHVLLSLLSSGGIDIASEPMSAYKGQFSKECESGTKGLGLVQGSNEDIREGGEGLQGAWAWTFRSSWMAMGGKETQESEEAPRRSEKI